MYQYVTEEVLVHDFLNKSMAYVEHSQTQLQNL